MKEENNKVPENVEDQIVIRQYLLGRLSDKTKMREIEENLLVDDEFAERLSVAEGELVEEYLDGNLSETEHQAFLSFFLVTSQGKQKLRFIQNLRKYTKRNKIEKRLAEEKNESAFWQRLFSIPSMRFAALILIGCGLVFGIWRVWFYQSDIDKGMAQLNLALAEQRLIESRLTGLNYAPPHTRGDTSVKIDEKALRRAETYFNNALENHSDAAAHHAWGLVLLAGKKIDEALDELKKAVSLEPSNAKFQSDLGAVYFEKAKIVEQAQKGADFLENIDAGLEHLNRATELDNSLPEPIFNKSLLLEKKGLTNQALEVWQQYLQRDSDSPWANEARDHIRRIESQKSQNLSADQVETAFLNAFRQKDEVQAWQLISQNRELVKGKYLPQKLAFSFTDATGGTKDEYLKALIYAGKLEEKNIGDSFANDLASYYEKISPSDLELTKQAQASVKNSYKSYLETNKINDTYEEANRARTLFLKAGNIYEAKLSEFLIVYCLIKKTGYASSLALSEDIAAFCRENNYKWLLASTLYWLGAAQRTTGERRKARISYQNCLDLAKEIRDAQFTQKILVSFAKQNKFVGQNRLALNYLQQAFAVSNEAPWLSLRERWRTNSESVEILASAKLYNLAKAISLENFQLAADSGDSSFIASSELDTGVIAAQIGDFEDSRKWLSQARQNAETTPEGSDRTEILAKSLLTLGSLERKLGNYSQAADFYDEALSIVKKDDYPFFLYEIERGRLLTDISLNKNTDESTRIAKIIDLAEAYRQQISTEQERNSFFNNRQDIYDIAVANEYDQSRYEEAYNYLEISNARSLLNWLKKGVIVKKDREAIEITFNENIKPVELGELRPQIPDGVQILQYAVLDDRVLIWLISKNKFTVVQSNIDFDSLNEEVNAYIALVSDPDRQKQEEAKIKARKLYEWLVAPIAPQLDRALGICLIPQKSLFHLPFSALSAPSGIPLIAEYNVFYAPSANVFLLSTEIARGKSVLTDESLLSIGNPRFDKTEYKDFQDLPAAEEEARAIKNYYSQTQLLIGLQATKSSVQNSLQDAEVINFAGHYIVKHGEPLASGLLLTKTESSNDAQESVLTNAELIGQKMPRVKLVVLSACETGVEQYYNGEGLVGLSRTFLAAGAPLVVASQWQVDSTATATLMKRFHFLRKQGNLTTTTALRQAQLEMMESTDERFRQPYYWAAFATYGGYAEF